MLLSSQNGLLKTWRALLPVFETLNDYFNSFTQAKKNLRASFLPTVTPSLVSLMLRANGRGQFHRQRMVYPTILHRTRPQVETSTSPPVACAVHCGYSLARRPHGRPPCSPNLTRRTLVRPPLSRQSATPHLTVRAESGGPEAQRAQSALLCRLRRARRPGMAPRRGTHAAPQVATN